MKDATTMRLNEGGIIRLDRGVNNAGETGRVREIIVRYDVIVLAYRRGWWLQNEREGRKQ
jgi:hypothetical protein